MHSISELIEDIAKSKMVILVDDEDRENEGDLICAGSTITPDAINFMAAKARGLICLSMSPERVETLNLPLMVPDDYNKTHNRTAFTISIEASQGVTTGISAADRAHTVLVASSPDAKAGDLISPGHIFPLRAKKGGVLERNGHTEASVDLVRMADRGDSAVICEIMNEDGTMARLPDLLRFSKKYDIKVGTIQDLIYYRKKLLEDGIPYESLYGK